MQRSRQNLKTGPIYNLFFLVLISVLWCSQLQAGTEATILFESGKKCFQTGDYHKAADFFTRVLEAIQPDTPQLHLVKLARAQAYYGTGDYKRAWGDLNSVLRSDDVNGETLASGLLLRGTLNLGQGRDKKAFEDFTAAINSSHGNASLRALSLTNRGIAFVNRGELDKAISDLNQAISIDPKSGFAFAARGLAHLRSDRIELARRDGERAMAMNPDPSTSRIARQVLGELDVSSYGQSSVTVPLNENGQIYVQVRFAKGGTPHRFLVDTGATHTVVDRSLLAHIARETQLREIGKTRVILADGSTHPVTRYRVANAFLFDVPLGEIEVQAFDRKTKGVMNLLGTKSLGKVAVSIDNARRKVEISRRASLADQKDAQ